MLQAIYVVDVRTELTGFAPNDGTVIISNGDNTRVDAPPLFYYYNATSTATNDGDNVITPTSVGGGAGRWLKCKFGYNDLANLPALATVATSGAYADLSGRPSLATVATSGLYADLSGKPSIPAAQIQADWNQASTGALDFIKNKPTLPAARSFNSTPGRILSTTGSNNTFTISTTRDTLVAYTVNFAAALTLTTSNGVVTLDYSTDGGTNWITLSRGSQTFGVSVTITTSQDQVLHGVVPANALVRINRSSNTNVTIALGAQQEVLL